jgi:hypothetical protein
MHTIVHDSSASGFEYVLNTCLILAACLVSLRSAVHRTAAASSSAS